MAANGRLMITQENTFTASLPEAATAINVNVTEAQSVNGIPPDCSRWMPAGRLQEAVHRGEYPAEDAGCDDAD